MSDWTPIAGKAHAWERRDGERRATIEYLVPPGLWLVTKFGTAPATEDPEMDLHQAYAHGDRWIDGGPRTGLPVGTARDNQKRLSEAAQ